MDKSYMRSRRVRTHTHGSVGRPGASAPSDPIPADNFCVIAGETSHLLERLLAHHLDTVHYERIDGETRINGTILVQESGTSI